MGGFAQRVSEGDMLRAKQEHLQAERGLIRVKHIGAATIADLSVYCAGLILLALILFLRVDQGTLLFWLLGNGAVVLYRCGVLASFRKLTVTARDRAGAYLVLFLIGIIFSGLSFGSAGFFLYPGDILHQMFLGLTISVVTTASANSSIPIRWVAVAYAFLMVVPFTIVSLLGKEELHLFLGVLGMLYLVVHLFYSMRLSNYFSENLSLQLDNLELTFELIHEVSSRIAVESRIKAMQTGVDA